MPADPADRAKDPAVRKALRERRLAREERDQQAYARYLRSETLEQICKAMGYPTKTSAARARDRGYALYWRVQPAFNDVEQARKEALARLEDAVRTARIGMSFATREETELDDQGNRTPKASRAFRRNQVTRNKSAALYAKIIHEIRELRGLDVPVARSEVVVAAPVTSEPTTIVVRLGGEPEDGTREE